MASLASLSLTTERGRPALVAMAAVVAAALGGFTIATQPMLVVIVALGLAILLGLSSMVPAAALTATLVLAPARTLLETESSLSLPLDIGQILITATLAVYSIWQIVNRRGLVQQSQLRQFLPLLIFLFVTGITAFNAVSVHAWALEWGKWVIVVVVMALTIYIGAEYRTWEWVVAGLVLAAAANAVIGVYIFFGGSGATHLLVNGRFFRAFGTFGQPNPFGGYMGLIAPIAIALATGYAHLAWRAWRRNRRIQLLACVLIVFYGICGLLIVAGLLLSWSRGAWLGFGVSIAALVLLIPRRIDSRLAVAAGIACVTLLAMQIGIMPGAISERINSAAVELVTLEDVRGVDITPDNYPIMERLAHWQAALNMARARPFLGVGFGNYPVAYDEYRLMNWPDSLGHAHNYYLNVLGEAGIIGLVAYLFMIGSMMRVALAARNHPDVIARSTSIGIFSALVYLITHSLTDNLFVNNVFVHIGVMFGIISILNSRRSFVTPLGQKS